MRLLLSLLCLVGGCGTSGLWLVGLTVTASTGAYPAFKTDALFACIPGLLGLVFAVVLIAFVGGSAPPAPKAR